MKALRIIIMGLAIFALQNALANCTSCTSSSSDQPYYKDSTIKPKKVATLHIKKKKEIATIEPKIISTKSHIISKRPRFYSDRGLTVTMYPGSLKANIVRIANSCGWNTVIWTPPEDYLWVGHTQIVAPDLYKALFQILAKYPVQAQLYQGNRVVAIVPRNLP